MAHCPTAKQLEQALAGQLDAPQSESIEAHVEGCPACQRLLNQLTGRADADPSNADQPATDLSLTPVAELDPTFRRRLEQEPPYQDRTTREDATNAAGPRMQPPDVPGYEIIEKLGHGGMGVVYKAWHCQLKRVVALKMVLAGAHADAEILTRFRTEVEAVARLQHPNIVQIYEVGERDGVPYCTLEYVEGESLARKLDGTPLPPAEAAALVETLARAMHYAHGRGIVHRDLKPANVLLQVSDKENGRQGDKETRRQGDREREGNGPVSLSPCPLVSLSPKITDFGLAKVLGGDARTRTGAVMGTPSYMAPEQVEGKNRQVGPAADVYALGAILYETLTGRPPFRAATALETVMQVAILEPVAPCRLQPQTPRDLETICLKCLRKEPTQRYGSAAALAEDLRRWQAGEPIRARPVGRIVRTVKWVRRKPVAAALLVAVALALTGAGWGLWQWSAQRSDHAKREAETDRTATAALAKADAALARAEALPVTGAAEAKAALGEWQNAQAALAEAVAALQTGAATDGVRRRVAEARERIERGQTLAQRKEKLFYDLDESRLAAAGVVENTFDFAGAAAKYQAAFAAYGLEVKPQETAELARRIRAEAPAVRTALLVALDDWTFAAAHLRATPSAADVEAIAAAADDDPWRQRLRQATTAHDGKRLRELSVEARGLSLPPSNLALLARRLDAGGERAAAVALLRWARDEHPTDFWIHFHLGTLLSKDAERTAPLDLEEALGCLRSALALRSQEAIVYNNLGIALKGKKQLDAAIAAYKKALALDPNFAKAHVNLGLAFALKKQWDDAIAAYQKAIALEPKYAPAYVNLGNTLAARNQLDDAIATYKKAIEVNPNLAPAHYNLGIALARKDRWDDAIDEFKNAIALDSNYTDAHINLGVALGRKNRWDDAIAELNKAIALDPKDVLAHTALGEALLQKGRFAEAKASTQQALKLLPDNHSLRPRFLQQLQQCNEQLALEGKLADVLAGQTPPADNRERLGLIEVCRRQQRYADAAKLYADAFTADAKLADDLQKQHRYNAACYAVLAAAGQGKDADKLDDKERARLRKQAVEWLRADLALWTKQADGDRALVQKTLKHWQDDADLAGIRDKDAVAKLPADERDVCQKLWTDAAELLKKAAAVK